MDSNYISFAHEHHKLNWSNVLFLKFGKFQAVNVWVAITQSGPFSVCFSESLCCEMDYLAVLNDIALPYIVGNEGTIFLQVRPVLSFINCAFPNIVSLYKEWNEVTTSEIVRSWFKKHPEIHCINWPSNCEVAFPISSLWNDMMIRLNSQRPLCSHRAKTMIIDFWRTLKPDFLQKSFTAVRDGLEKIKDEHFNFARAHFELDWKKVLFSKYAVVRCVSVWVAGTHLGPLNISIINGLLSEAHYINILNEIVLPFLMRNRDVTYIQVTRNTFVKINCLHSLFTYVLKESNEVTKSEGVCSWFLMRPDIKCITWPPIVSPMSVVWDGINEHVDNSFPLTSGEITKFVLEFWEKAKKETPNYFPNSFTSTKQIISVLDK